MNERVLVVEDSAYQRARIRECLEPTFDVVAEAADGETAVERFREHDPDAVTMDFALPVQDGPAATAEIKAIDPSAVVVFCSCVTQQAQLKRAVRAGADDYVHKPFDDGDLASTLRGSLAPPTAEAEQADSTSDPEID
ncbi:response regulator [Halobaculum marinum]|uniref:Response regulator n=1 Tax=Halobaculum marinum TaxID=3031996 RepID=A0ABD5X114_9EURY|nr:response regulator [Halobaculum sp. DT55]